MARMRIAPPHHLQSMPSLLRHGPLDDHLSSGKRIATRNLTNWQRLVAGLLVFLLVLGFWISPSRSPADEKPALSNTGRPAVPGSQIDGALAQLSDKDSKIIQEAWEKVTYEAGKKAEEHFRKSFVDSTVRPCDLPEGIPGTGISTAEEARALQAYLDCTTSNGRWVKDLSGSHLARLGTRLPVHKQSAAFATCDKAHYRNRQRRQTDATWDVRPELKWRWEASAECNAMKRPEHVSKAEDVAMPSRYSLCSALQHKHILLIGPSPTQYTLHDLLLDWTTEAPVTCYGDLYCKEHAICGNAFMQKGAKVDTWTDDSILYDALPSPSSIKLKYDQTAHKDRSPQSQEVVPGKATILRFRRSDSMFLNSSPSHPRHQPAHIHPDIGVRDANMYAVADARRSDVVLLHKAPLPFPRASPNGNSLNRRLTNFAATLEEPLLLPIDRTNKLLELVKAITTELWLPEVIESLRALKMPPAPQDNLIIYHSGWQHGITCIGADDVSKARNSTVLARSIASGIFRDGLGQPDTAGPQDRQNSFYNLQLKLQNHLMRIIILPKLGIPFIDVDTAMSDLSGGRLASSQSRQVHDQGQIVLEARQARDCLRPCLPSPGLALERLLLGSLLTTFEWGWQGPERSQVWTGQHFLPVRERQKQAHAG